MEQINWDQCLHFIKRINDELCSQLNGMKFRLPTEAEWEFAARGGTKSCGYKYSGSDLLYKVAWCGRNSNSETHEVATLQPNELGIYDMSGNVNEWCLDRFDVYENSIQTNPVGPKCGGTRVIRGGSWSHLRWIDFCSSSRSFSDPHEHFANIGLRLALSE